MVQLVKIAEHSPNPAHCIIFIHGLGGHPYETWENPNTKAFWPELIAKSVDDCSVWCLGYRAPKTNWTGRSLALQDRAVSVLETISTTEGVAGKPLLFVCHSLGGLVVKQFLRIANEQGTKNPTWKRIAENTKGIVFCGTPHIGSDIATLTDRLRFLIWPSQSTLGLIKNDAHLRRLNTWFRNWDERPHVRIFYETESTVIAKVVDEGSADAGIPGVEPVPIEASHSDICKPGDANALIHRSTVKFIGSIDRFNTVCDEQSSMRLFERPDILNENSGQLLVNSVRLAFIVLLSMIMLIGSYNLIEVFRQPEGRGIAESWVEAATKAQEENLISHDRPIPVEFGTDRSEFENWWRNSPFEEKRQIDNNLVYSALSKNGRIYRTIEQERESKPNSRYWITQSIEYFERVNDRELLAESLIDQSALLLDLTQITHTDPSTFRALSEEGSSVITRAETLASDDQKPTLFRIASRFYYNLARPSDGELDQQWDNELLMLAYGRAKDAVKVQPDEIRNVLQVANVTLRIARNPPNQDSGTWTTRLRSAQTELLESWRQVEAELQTPRQRIPKLNVLATITLDVVSREFRERGDDIPRSEAARLLAELEGVSISNQRDILVAVRSTEWAEDYTFDMRYDLSRMYVMASEIARVSDENAVSSYLELAYGSMSQAIDVGSATQMRSARRSIDTDASLSSLSGEDRERMIELFN